MMTESEILVMGTFSLPVRCRYQRHALQLNDTRRQVYWRFLHVLYERYLCRKEDDDVNGGVSSNRLGDRYQTLLVLSLG